MPTYNLIFHEDDRGVGKRVEREGQNVGNSVLLWTSVIGQAVGRRKVILERYPVMSERCRAKSRDCSSMRTSKKHLRDQKLSEGGWFLRSRKPTGHRSARHDPPNAPQFLADR